MKKLYLIFLVVVWGIWGCSDSVGPTSDANTIHESTISGEPNWIKLPAQTGKSLKKTVTIQHTVLANRTNNIAFKEKFKGGPSGEYEINFKMNFPVGCIDQDLDVTLTCDTETGVITALPSMEFIVPVELEYWLSGMELNEGDEDLVDFVYLNPDGTYESIERHMLKVKVDHGEIKLYKAQLWHWTRFGTTL